MCGDVDKVGVSEVRVSGVCIIWLGLVTVISTWVTPCSVPVATPPPLHPRISACLYVLRNASFDVWPRTFSGLPSHTH